MPLMLGPITPEMEKAILEAHKREVAFFTRHNCADECDPTNPKATPAHRAWMIAADIERKHQPHFRPGLDTPLGRIAFIIGYRAALSQPVAWPTEEQFSEWVWGYAQANKKPPQPGEIYDYLRARIGGKDV